MSLSGPLIAQDFTAGRAVIDTLELGGADGAGEQRRREGMPPSACNRPHSGRGTLSQQIEQKGNECPDILYLPQFGRHICGHSLIDQGP